MSTRKFPVSTLVGVFVGILWCVLHRTSLNLRGHFRGHLRVHSRGHFREHFRERVRGSNFAVRVLCAFLNTGVSPSSSLTMSWCCNLQPRVCHLCCNAKLIPDWGKTDGVKSESRSVPMAESNVAAVADVLKNPPRTCLCLAASVRQAPKP